MEFLGIEICGLIEEEECDSVILYIIDCSAFILCEEKAIFPSLRRGVLIVTDSRMFQSEGDSLEFELINWSTIVCLN